MAAQTIRTPLMLEKGEAYSNSMINTQKITIHTSNDEDDYAFMLPITVGNAGQYLRSDGQFYLTWEDLAIKMMTSSERLNFGLVGYTPIGTIVYDTTASQTFIWTGTAWLSISGSAVDSTFFITDNVDPTKRLRFEVSSVAPGTTRVITMADRDLDLAAPTFESVAVLDTGSAFTTTIRPFAGMAASYTITLPDQTTLPAFGLNAVLQTNSNGETIWTRSPALASPVIQTSLIMEDPAVGTNTITIQAPAAPTTHVLTLPGALPTAASMLVTDPTGTLGWQNTVSDLTTDKTEVIGAALPLGYSAGIALSPEYDDASGGYAVALHNYISLNTPTVLNTATVTSAAVMQFNAAPGTHAALDAASVKVTPGGVDAWIKISVETAPGVFTPFYVPAYLSKVA